MNNGENQYTCFSCDHSMCLTCVKETAIYKETKVPRLPDRREMARPVTWPATNKVWKPSSSHFEINRTLISITAPITSPGSSQHYSHCRGQAGTLPGHISTAVSGTVISYGSEQNNSDYRGQASTLPGLISTAVSGTVISHGSKQNNSHIRG